MAIPAVHIAPPGTNAVDARWMARWLSGGGSMVVSSGTSLYRRMHTCGIQCRQSVRSWLCSGGARPHGSQRHKEVRESVVIEEVEKPQKRCGVSSGQVVARIYCHNRFPQIWKGGPREPDLAQLLGQALSHQVSDSDRGWFMGVS